MKATEGALPFFERDRSILINFGASHPFAYSARQIARARFEPKISSVLALNRTIDDLSVEPNEPYAALMWRQTGGRFSPGYYKRLKQTQVIACFCGDIIPPIPERPESYLVGGGRARLKRLAFDLLGKLDRHPPRAVGADSFRFWEGLAAGCATINLDLDYYGVELPVRPVNGIHYIGVNFNRLNTLIERITDEPGLLGRVAQDGRVWAETYFSPVAVARRFLKMVYPAYSEGSAVPVDNG